MTKIPRHVEAARLKLQYDEKVLEMDPISVFSLFAVAYDLTRHPDIGSVSAALVKLEPHMRDERNLKIFNLTMRGVIMLYDLDELLDGDAASVEMYAFIERIAQH